MQGWQRVPVTNKFKKESPPSRLDSDLTGKAMIVDHQNVEECAGLPEPELPAWMDRVIWASALSLPMGAGGPSYRQETTAGTGTPETPTSMWKAQDWETGHWGAAKLIENLPVRITLKSNETQLNIPQLCMEGFF
jgi:hypothetical protein